MRRTIFTTALTSALLFCSTGLISAQTSSTPPKAVAAETATLARGWSALATGDMGVASKVAAEAVASFPRSGAAIAFAVEVELTGRGVAGALETYERWLARKATEDAYTVRRIAHALLREAARNERDRVLQVEAADALFAEGDPDAFALLPAAESQSPAEAAARAATGDDRALRALIAQAESPGPARRIAIESLARTRNERTVRAVTSALTDPDPIVRTAAAEALGSMGAAAAIPRLKTLLNDTNFRVHFAAAAALFALHDTSGLLFLQELQRSEHAAIRVAAARATRQEPTADWLATVRELVRDSDAEVRRQAAELIAPHDPALARATLEALLSDPNPAERQAAADSLVQYVTDDVAVLRGYLSKQDAALRIRAAGRLLELTR